MTESNILFALLRHQICGEEVGEEVKQAIRALARLPAIEIS